MNKPIIVVSGLPRSGTSLLMQMLEAAEVPLLTDQIRKADSNNPRGYYEYEPVKNLMTDNSWLHHAEGKAVKVIVQLLPYLPDHLPFSVILLRRKMAEILKSQEVMLAQLNQPFSFDATMLASVFERQIEAAIDNLTRRPLTRWTEVGYDQLIKDKSNEVSKIIEFLEIEPKFQTQMLAQIEPKLHRSKA